MSYMDECWTWREEDDEGKTVCGPCAKFRRVVLEEDGFVADHHYPDADTEGEQ